MTSTPDRRREVGLVALAALGLLLLPWYAQQDGLWSFEWLPGYPTDAEAAPAVWLLAQGASPWLWPLVGLVLVGLAVGLGMADRRRRGEALMWIGGAGLVYLFAQGYALGLQGWSFDFLTAVFGETGQRQFGMGYGALLVATGFLFLFTWGLSASGRVLQDPFVSGALGLIIALVGLFVLMPVAQMLLVGLRSEDGSALAALADRLVDPKIWRLNCLTGLGQCGSAWNSLGLAVAVGFLTTLLGLAFALVVTRTDMPFKRVIKALTLLPIITPPFVIGLAVILLLGLSGVVTQWVASVFGIAPSRWIYGFNGVLLAQVLAFTPISFLVLVGVVEAVSPSMEEASQTLRASDWVTFRTVTWPLLRPGLANAFLLGFIESMADFGNPMVLGGNFTVLSTEIFFAIVGSQNDQARAAVLALILLAFTIAAFAAQNLWLGRSKRYTTVSGKGEGGMHPPLPRSLAAVAIVVTLLWTLFTLVVYGLIVYGSFVELWGRNWSLTLRHYLQGFEITFNDHGLHWKGSAWNSLATTLKIALIAAPLTAAIGLLTAWLLARQQFAGKQAFEIGTLLSFAIPGTVIGVSYIVAFNVPPLELTGTAVILVICFVFRNMPVGVRAGIASLAQIDKSLDEASLTLRASSATTFQRVTLPLIRPAILSAMVYSFVQAMTAISAVVFLVSARHDMATTYIIGRVENNEYGIAIAYSTVLIFVMLVGILLFQWLSGTRRLGRHGLRGTDAPVLPTSA